MAPVASTGYRRIAGRRFQSEATGEVISRRQFDKLSGRIQGSYEAKAKANKVLNPQLSAARPARGRKSSVSPITTRFKNLKTTANKKFVDMELPIHYRGGIMDIPRIVKDFGLAIDGLKVNPRAFGVTTNIIFMDSSGELDGKNLIPTATWPTTQKLEESFELLKDKYKFLEEVKFLYLSLHLIFKSQYMKTL